MSSESNNNNKSDKELTRSKKFIIDIFKKYNFTPDQKHIEAIKHDIEILKGKNTNKISNIEEFKNLFCDLNSFEIIFCGYKPLVHQKNLNSPQKRFHFIYKIFDISLESGFEVDNIFIAGDLYSQNQSSNLTQIAKDLIEWIDLKCINFEE